MSDGQSEFVTATVAIERAAVRAYSLCQDSSGATAWSPGSMFLIPTPGQGLLANLDVPNDQPLTSV